MNAIHLTKRFLWITVVAAATTVCASVQAQKITQGSLEFLKGETALKIAFDYDGMKVNGKTEQLTTGYMAGPMSKPAVATVQVVFTKIGSSEAPETVEIKNARTNGFDLSKYTLTGKRIGSAYGYVGQVLAVTIIRKSGIKN